MSYTDDEYCDVLQQQQAKLAALQAAGAALAKYITEYCLDFTATVKTHEDRLLAAWNAAKEMK